MSLNRTSLNLNLEIEIKQVYLNSFIFHGKGKGNMLDEKVGKNLLYGKEK